MNALLQRIDPDTTWFVIAVLVVLLLSAVAAVVVLKMEIKEHDRRRLIVDARKHADWERVCNDLDTPAFQREAKHPLDSIPYDLRAVIHPEPEQETNWKRIN